VHTTSGQHTHRQQVLTAAIQKVFHFLSTVFGPDLRCSFEVHGYAEFYLLAVFSMVNTHTYQLFKKKLSKEMPKCRSVKEQNHFKQFFI
jgi:hypothetical protein